MVATIALIFILRQVQKEINNKKIIKSILLVIDTIVAFNGLDRKKYLKYLEQTQYKQNNCRVHWTGLQGLVQVVRYWNERL